MTGAVRSNLFLLNTNVDVDKHGAEWNERQTLAFRKRSDRFFFFLLGTLEEPIGSQSASEGSTVE